MNQSVKKILTNISLLAVLFVGSFYIIHTMNQSEDDSIPLENDFDSPLRLRRSYSFESPIESFAVSANIIVTVFQKSIVVIDSSGNELFRKEVREGVRDVALKRDTLYLLYPNQIFRYRSDTTLTLIDTIKSCSDNSDYVAISISDNNFFVTDAENKNICIYNSNGEFKRFFNSPVGFVIPSYTFDMEVINDTVYCVNSGKHLIESFTLEGDYISSWGKQGGEIGNFAGCCNPAYIASDGRGGWYTSEKGILRVVHFDKRMKPTQILGVSQLGRGYKGRVIHVENNMIYVALNNELKVYDEPRK